MVDQKKFLDYEGVKYLWSKINMQDYPNNETLMDVIEAIDETKADKTELPPVTNEAHKVLTTNANGEKVWEDKLCYSYREEYLVHPGYTIPEGKKMVYMPSVPIVAPIAEGETYSIIWDDQEYICVAYSSTSFGIALGNESLMNANCENTNEPFFFGGWQDFNMAQLFCAADTNGHTFKEVKGIKDFYIPIDGNYIAGGVYPGSGAASTVIGAGQATGTGSVSINASYSHGTQTFSEGFGTVHENSTWGHAEGGYTHVYGDMGHAEGYGTISHGIAQHVQGRKNIPDKECKYAHIVGNGESIDDSNAHTLDWEGNAWFAGDVYVNSTSGTNKDEGSKKLATEEYVNELIASIEIATDDEIIDMLIEEDMFAAVIDSDGAMLADENNNILLW